MTESRTWLLGIWDSEQEEWWKTGGRIWGNFGSDEYIHYHDFSDGFRDIYFDIYIKTYKIIYFTYVFAVYYWLCNSVEKKEERERVKGGKEARKEKGKEERLVTWINKPYDNLPGKVTHQHNLKELSMRSPRCFQHIPPWLPNSNRVKVATFTIHCPKCFRNFMKYVIAIIIPTLQIKKLWSKWCLCDSTACAF